MQGYRSPGGLQRFVAVFFALRNLFAPTRSRLSALATHLHRPGTMALESRGQRHGLSLPPGRRHLFAPPAFNVTTRSRSAILKMLLRDQGCLDAAADAELGQDVRYVEFHRLHLHAGGLGNLAIGEAATQ